MNFWWKFDRRGPYKNSENLVLSQIVLKKIFFGKIIFSFHQKKCFSTILGTFWKFEFLTEFDRRDPYKNSENLVLSQIVLNKYFLDKLFVPLIKEVFLHNFRQFLENWIFDGNSTGADLTKISENLVLSQIVWRKYFLDKLFVPLIKEVFLHNFRQFLEN